MTCLSLSGFGSARQSRRRPAARDGEGLLSHVSSQRRAPGRASSERASCSWTRPVNFNRFFLHGELSYLSCVTACTTTVLCTVCGHADLTGHWSHTSASLHDRTKTTNGSCSSESPPRNSGMLPESTVRRSTLGSTSSRPAVAFFSRSKQKVTTYIMLCGSAWITPLPFFVTKPMSSWPCASTGQRGQLCAAALAAAAACCLQAAHRALRVV